MHYSFSLFCSQFEEWPTCPKTSFGVSREETDYVTVKPGAAAHSTGGGESEGRGVKKTSTEKTARKQQKKAVEDHGSEDEEDEVTYTHVTFNPKHRK